MGSPRLYLLDNGCICIRYKAGVPALELVWKPANAGSAFDYVVVGQAFAMMGSIKSVASFHHSRRGKVVGVVSRKFLDKCISDSLKPCREREW